MQWHAADNNRSLPWKEEKDPYRIWLSEVILQQTRAQQGLPYYKAFTGAYPAIQDMAAARDEEVFRLWQGLGYYNRCRNMLATARYIAHERSGIFPDNYNDIVSLKGVGPYTAAAIASFAYGLPHAVVDGNVYRVLSRYFGIDTPIDSTAGKKQFTELANQLLDTEDSAGYNQAIMDLGATVCKPANPSCDDCPLQKNCFAYNRGTIADLPVKSKKLQVKKRHFHYLFFIHRGKTWIHKRTGKDIWQNLYEPYLHEAGRALNTREIEAVLQPHTSDIKDLKEAGTTSQRLTHRIIESRFYIVNLKKQITGLPANGQWVSIGQLDDFAFPKTIVSFLQKKSYF